jgi:hypothetical protein
MTFDPFQSPPPSAPEQARPVAPASVDRRDWGIVVAGGLALIFSLFDYYTVSVKGLGSDSASAWHGIFGWFGALVALAGSVILAIHVFAPHIRMSIQPRLAALGAFALATLCVLLAWFITPGASSVLGLHIDYGRGAGFYLSLIVIVGGLVLSVLRVRATIGWPRSLSR